MKELYRTVSFDDQRTFLDQDHVVKNNISDLEFVNLELISQHLRKTEGIQLGDSIFVVKTPNIISVNTANRSIFLELCDGDNLEQKLETTFDETRNKYLDITKAFVLWMKTTGTFWAGAAPRHIIINDPNKTVSIVDFEREILLDEKGFEDTKFNSLIRGLVFEEFGAFLFENEQEDIFPNLWENLPQEEIQPDSIKSMRVKLLIKHFFGIDHDTVSSEKFATIQKFMAKMVTPFYVGNVPFFPLRHIDNKVKNNPYEFVKSLIELTQLKQDMWPNYFKNENN